MYTREILPPRPSPIENGLQIFGTWNTAFEKVDLQEIRKPYGYPLPRRVRDCRLKEWESFSINDDRFMLEALFCNVKLYRFFQVLFYDKETGQKFLFKNIKPGTGKRLPLSLANSSLDNHSSQYYFRIHSWLDADTIKLDINIEAFRSRPSFTAHLAYNLSSHDVVPMAVSLGITEHKGMYAYKALSPVRGDIVFDGRHINLKHETCSGFFCDYKGYFPYRMRTTICSGTGFNEENKRFGFHIAENQTRETYKNNENALWLDGKLTPLPPVRITNPVSLGNAGTDADWVIQDVEGMVDLTFTPKERNKSGANLIFTNVDFSTTLGYYNGMLVSAEGEKIQIKNLFGLGEKLYLRV